VRGSGGDEAVGDGAISRALGGMSSSGRDGPP
jgi:hypothetical protein